MGEVDRVPERKKRSIIKFSPSFRQSCRENLGLSDDEVRQIELDVIKHQKALREGLE